MDTTTYKTLLLEERIVLTEEIEALGTMRVSNENFDVKAEEGVHTTENLELADMFEIETNKDAVLDQLEDRLIAVELALGKIESGTYGICEVSGETIEPERLLANPAARTNIANREAVLD
jgi:RNA polymerase-binding transcription factor DksA